MQPQLYWPLNSLQGWPPTSPSCKCFSVLLLCFMFVLPSRLSLYPSSSVTSSLGKADFWALILWALYCTYCLCNLFGISLLPTFFFFFSFVCGKTAWCGLAHLHYVASFFLRFCNTFMILLVLSKTTLLILFRNIVKT